jgi:lysophospholipase L1-like esterase
MLGAQSEAMASGLACAKAWTRLAAFVALASAAAFDAAPASASQPGWCSTRTPAAYLSGSVGPAAALQALRGKIDRRETITIVVIGSSSTEGSDLANRRDAYPHKMAERLSLALGEGRVRLVNRGRGGETIPDTVARFERDVIAEKPDLLIWQLGANDIVRRADPIAAAAAVDAGFGLLKTSGAPVLMMDSQLAPSVTASPTLKPMREKLEKAASRHQALLWSRFDLMRDLIAKGLASERDLTKPDNLHMTEAMHACTGALLAETLLDVVAPATTAVRR